jgi:hypothetical protein
MELFEEVFNGASIYDMLFFNTKAVLIHPTLTDLQEKNPAMYERWKYLSGSKYDRLFDSVLMSDVGYCVSLQKVYEEKAIFYPEFSRIVAITYASVYSEEGKTKRFLKKIVNEDEFTVLATFMDVLYQLSSEGVKSSPQYFPTLCGHNILNYDIPLIIKRFLKHKEGFKEKLKSDETLKLPYILKSCLAAKPWESKVIDTVNVWKFNGNDYSPLMLIADYLGLKKTIELSSLPELNKYYWDNVNEKPEETLEHISLQSATQTNLVIQFMNELRGL